MSRARLRRVLAVVLVAIAACTGSSDDGGAPGDAADATTTSVPTTAVPATTSTTTTTTTPPTTVASAIWDGTTCAPVPSRRPPDPRRPTYRIDMTADPVTGVVTGTQVVDFVPDLAVGEIVFRLWANSPRPASVGTGIRIDAVRVDGAPPVAADLPDATTLVVRLPAPKAIGQTVRIELDWTLTVAGTVNDRISRQSGSLRLGSFVPLLAWEPGIGWARDAPTGAFAEATTSPTADWEVGIGAPAGFGVIATGIEVEPGHWQARAARDFAVAIGRFTVAEATASAPDPVTVRVAVHDGLQPASDYLGQIVAHLERLAELYGPYPWSTYQVSITPSLSGGIEFPMHVLQGVDTQGRTTPHEVAHMWFYGLVGNNQGRYPWLDEGLATYAEGRLMSTLGSMAARSIPAAAVGHAGEPMPFWESRQDSYYRGVYVQTAAALSRLGPVEAVDCVLAHYVAVNAHRIATPPDLAAVLDQVFTDAASSLGPAGLP